MIENLLRDIIIYQETVKDEVDNRIYYVTAPQQVEQGDDTYLVLTKISHSPNHNFGSTSGWASDVVRFTVHGRTYHETKTVILKLKKLFRDLTENETYFLLPWQTVEGKIWLQATNVDNEVDHFEDSNRMFYSHLSVTVMYDKEVQ